MELSIGYYTGTIDELKNDFSHFSNFGNKSSQFFSPLFLLEDLKISLTKKTIIF